MNQKYEMYEKVLSSSHYQKMIKSVQPLYDHLGVNFFWYDKVTYSGKYEFFGTHSKWAELCAEHLEWVMNIPYLYHPESAVEGVQLLGISTDQKLQEILAIGREKCHLNFNLHLLKKTADGVEGFGLSTASNSPKVYERLINELPLINRFIEYFKQKNLSIFEIVREHSVDLKRTLGITFKKPQKNKDFTETMLREMGYDIPPFTKREQELLEYVAHGFPASYISDELALSVRTIETHLNSFKNKLNCTTKSELIEKAKELVALKRKLINV